MKIEKVWYGYGASVTVIATMLAFGAFGAAAWIVGIVGTLSTVGWCVDRFYTERRVERELRTLDEVLATVKTLTADVSVMRDKLGQHEMALNRNTSKTLGR